MNQDIQCEPIGPKEIVEQVLEYESCYFGDDAITNEQLEKIQGSPKWCDMAYIIDGRVAAYAFIKRSQKRWSRSNRIWVARFVVGHEFRKMGLGKQLESTICCGPFKYVCHVPESWISSQLALKALGWKAVGIDEGHYSNQVSYRFVKKLT